jgi:hypothetical protein
MFQMFPHSFAFWICRLYNSLFKCCLFLYRNLISFFILSVLVCVSVCFAVSEVLAAFMWICAYFGVMFCLRQVLLKYIFALQLSNFLLVVIYFCMLYA